MSQRSLETVVFFVASMAYGYNIPTIPMLFQGPKEHSSMELLSMASRFFEVRDFRSRPQWQNTLPGLAGRSLLFYA
jgi:hypothetical protein